MEFNEKLQELRKQKGLTQEELAQMLYVSRTAISKWESGRGFPNIESLKAISKFFSVSLDELLSGEEILVIAEEDHKKKEANLYDIVFGLLNCGAALLLFLPFFGQKTGETMRGVSLFALTEIQMYLKILYFSAVICITLMGLLSLALQNCKTVAWVRSKTVISLLLDAFAMLLFVISQQPYAAVYIFAFLAVKTILLIKR